MNSGTESVSSVYVGGEPIKTILLGETVLYNRPGGFIYINLVTDVPQTTNTSN